MDQGRGRHGPISRAAEEALEIAHEEVAATNRNLKEEVVERALVTASGTVLHVVDQVEQPKDSPELIKTLEEIEKDHITRILGRTSWRVEGPSGVARILGLTRAPCAPEWESSEYRKLRQCSTPCRGSFTSIAAS
jgi:transcriptional regulator with GAF, ATPase, and Fis domain